VGSSFPHTEESFTIQFETADPRCEEEEEVANSEESPVLLSGGSVAEKKRGRLTAHAGRKGGEAG